MTTNQRFWFAMVIALMMTAAAHAQSLVGTWTANNNGSTGTIVVSTQDGSGNITGTAFGNPMKGFYSAVTNKMMFYRAIGGNLATTPPDQIQIYTGYTFK